MFRFYFDNILIDSPINWDALELKIKRDNELKAVYIQTPQDMIFGGSGFKYLKNILESVGFCSQIEVRIEKQCDSGFYPLITGIIFINQCEFNNFRCEVSAFINDNSFFSKIFNNKNLTVKINVEKTKNSIPITAAAKVNLDFFNSNNGNYNNGFAVAGTREAFDWFDLFGFFVRFMTDGQLGVVSDWYANLPSTEKLAILSGKELRLANGIATNFLLSFAELTSDIFKEFNLVMSFDNGKIRVEKKDYYFNTTSLFQLDKIKDVVQLFSESQFFSRIILGSSKFLKEEYYSTLWNLKIIPGITFIEEQYLVKGICNVDIALDLKYNKYIKDHNIIHEVLINNNDSYDNDLFLIQYDSANNKAVKNPMFARFYYNEIMMNQNTLKRYELANDAIIYIGTNQNRFLAAEDNLLITRLSNSMKITAFLDVIAFYDFNTSTYINPVLFIVPAFEDDFTLPNFDFGNNYNNTLYKYTAPTDGSYLFRMKFNKRIAQEFTPCSGDTIKTTIRTVVTFGRYDAGNNLIEQETITMADLNGTTEFIGYDTQMRLFADKSFTLSNSDYVKIIGLGFVLTKISGAACADSGFGKIIQNMPGVLPSEIGTFEALETPDTSAYSSGKDPINFKISNFSFQRKISDNQMKLLISSPNKAVTINEDGFNNRKVWVDDITIKLKDNTGTFLMISDKRNSN